MAPRERITERANPLTRHLDTCSPAQACRLVAACERQVFGEGQARAGVMSRHFVRALTQALQRSRGATLIAGGAGTSGRLGELVAHVRRGAAGKRPRVLPVLAGGAAAFAKPAAMVEDKPDLGAAGVHAALAAARGPAVVVGITCGLSAPFVAGMVSSRAEGLRDALLLGFCEARDAVIDVAGLSAAQQAPLLLNPLLGAEAVAGSVRMKSATATLMILLLLSDPHWDGHAVSQRSVRARLARYGELLRFEEQVFDELGPLANAAAGALKAGATVSLIGFDDIGLVCAADAAECRATFNSPMDCMTPRVLPPPGASDDLVRRLRRLGEAAFADVEQLRADLGGALHTAFKVFVLRTEELALCQRLGLLSQVPPGSGAVIELCTGASATVVDGLPHVRVRTPAEAPGDEALVARALVTMLTTVLWVRAGRVFGNRMINHRISVRKLFVRAVGIIDEHLQCGRVKATELLQRSIAGGNARQLPGVRDVDAWVALASAREHLIPRAILWGHRPEAGDHELDTLLARGEGVRAILARLKA